LVDQLMTKAHDHIFGVVGKDVLGASDLGRHELGKGIELVLCLLGGTRMDAGGGTTRARATTSAGEGLGTTAKVIGRARATERTHVLSGLGDDATLRRSADWRGET
jgi:hypothetical protein